MIITQELVQKLIVEQFPQFQDIDIQPVEKSGHDNRTFHLGEEMIIRLPSGPEYALQVEKENKWLPYLSQSLSLPISQPLYLGKPSQDYPYSWSILKYLQGETVTHQNIQSLESLAVELSDFLFSLQKIDIQDAPKAGQHNFYRGGDLKVYHQETMEALEIFENADVFKQIWNNAISSTYQAQDVWIHGDIAPGNILVENGHLCGMIDFGIMGVGDPACDYAMAWTFFKGESRTLFLKNIPTDMINRAMGWALWKALITYQSSQTELAQNAHETIQEILKDYGRTQ